MESSFLKSQQVREKRALRVRKHLKGSASKPRLCVVKTNSHVYAQIINDDAAVTICAVSTLSKELRGTEFNKKNKEAAREVGLKIAQLGLAKDVTKIVFDRGPFKYHGVIAAVADGAREGGLKF